MTIEQRALLDIIRLTCTQMMTIATDTSKTEDADEKMFNAGMRYVLNDLQPKIEKLAKLVENPDVPKLH